MRYKKLLEEMYTLDEGTRENDFRYNKNLQKIPRGADPDDYEWEDEIGYVKKVPRNVNSVREHSRTIETYLEKKPFRKFSMKQVEIIFKAVVPKLASKLINHDVKLQIYNSNSTNILGCRANDENNCLIAQWNSQGKYLAVGYWLKDDFAFLKGGKAQTVYVEQAEIEKYYGMKIGEAGLLNSFKENDLIYVVGEGKKDGKGYCDSIIAQIAEFTDPYTMKVNILKSVIKDNDLREKEVGTVKRVDCFATTRQDKVIDTITIDVKNSIKLKGGDQDIDITKFINVSKFKKFLEPISYSKITCRLVTIRRHGLEDLPQGFKK